MARYTGPKTKIARKFGEAIFGPDKYLSRRNFPPGQHGNNKRRKTSEYGSLDNIVYRLGIAKSRAAARQLVSHRHITVDGKVVNIPSYSVKPGQLVAVRERSKSLEVIADSLAGFNHAKYPWLEWDESTKVGKFLHVPERADIPENIKEHLIVELYSK